MKYSANKKLFLNTVLPLLLEVTVLISGFILPRLIMGYYGSNVNGLVSSIKHFLAIISFFELGVGSVIRYNLYKPLVEKDNVQLSKVVRSGQKFFNNLAKILFGYVIILIIVYPYLADKEFDHLYTATLIAAISISYFARYYFGLVNQLLLTANQKGYIQSTAQILTIILNTVVTVILIKFGVSIHIVELSTSIIYLLRPIYLQWYVQKNYQIDKHVQYVGEPIKQKWNGIAQHFSAVVLDNTDVIVLTLLSTLTDVSIYNAYHMVVYGIKKLINTATLGIQARIGEIIAKDDKELLKNAFDMTEWSIHTAASLLFSCTGALIVPFILVYTHGVTDANYNVPLFGFLLTLANAGHSLRLPYSILILSGGHYKATQHNYIIVAIINIVISVALVIKVGLIGVAIGTVVAMLYQTVWMAYYTYRNVLKENTKKFWKQFIVDCLEFVSVFAIAHLIPISHESYFMWALSAAAVFTMAVVVTVIYNVLFYRKHIMQLYRLTVKKHKR